MLLRKNYEDLISPYLLNQIKIKISCLDCGRNFFKMIFEININLKDYIFSHKD